MAVIAYIIFTLKDSLLPNAPGNTTTTAYNDTYKSIENITAGFDSSVDLLIVAITIFVLALAISALLLLRGRQG